MLDHEKSRLSVNDRGEGVGYWQTKSVKKSKSFFGDGP